MYSEDDQSDQDINMGDVSLGREIMQAVKLQDRRVSHAGRRQSQDKRVSNVPLVSSLFFFKNCK